MKSNQNFKLESCSFISSKPNFINRFDISLFCDDILDLIVWHGFKRHFNVPNFKTSGVNSTTKVNQHFRLSGSIARKTPSYFPRSRDNFEHFSKEKSRT